MRAVSRRHRHRVPVLVIALLLGALAVAPAGGARAQQATPVAAGPTISATGTGVGTAPATTATVQLVISDYGSYGMSAGPAEGGSVMVIEPGTDATPIVVSGGDAGADAGGWSPYAPASLTEDRLQPVAEALVAAGLARDAIEVRVPAQSDMMVTGPGGPMTGEVRFTLHQPNPERIQELVTVARAAATEIALTLDQAGVRYGGADCAAVVQAARVDAVTQAKAGAEGLAQALGVTLGDLVSAADSPYGPVLDTGGCMPGLNTIYGVTGGSFPPFDPDAPAEVTVYLQVTLTYAIA